jgi:hypothetical protein
VSFPQLSDESRCRRVLGNAGYSRGHRAPIEHRDGNRCSIGGRGGEAVKALKQRTFDPLAARTMRRLGPRSGRLLTAGSDHHALREMASTARHNIRLWPM